MVKTQIRKSEFNTEILKIHIRKSEFNTEILKIHIDTGTISNYHIFHEIQQLKYLR